MLPIKYIHINCNIMIVFIILLFLLYLLLFIIYFLLYYYYLFELTHANIVSLSNCWNISFNGRFGLCNL